MKIGTVNCRKARDVCGTASIDDWPAVRWYAMDKKADPEVFEGDFTSTKSIGKYVSSMMPDFTTKVTDMLQLKDFVAASKGPAVLLFTDKKEAPPMWKALSREYNNRASLAFVPKCDKTGVFKTPVQREFDVYIPGIVHAVWVIAKK